MSTHYNVMDEHDLPCKFYFEGYEDGCPHEDLGGQREEIVCAECGHSIIFNPNCETLTDDDVLGTLNNW